MIEFNFYEWCALGVCVMFILCAVLFTWLFGDRGCCGNCDQGRQCRCNNGRVR